MEGSSQSTFSEDIKSVMQEISDSAQNKGGKVANECRGKLFLPFFSAECMEFMMNDWKIPENSVIVASYPKTGTTWCLEIVRQILYGSNESQLESSRTIPFAAHFLETGSRKKFDVYPNFPIPRKFFFTHVPAELFNFESLKKSNSKVIYVYRNPKDQAVSWYHFVTKLGMYTEEQKNSILGKDWNEFFDKYTAGEHPTGVGKGEWYPEHLVGWMKQIKCNKDILLVEYESLKKDFASELVRISEFLGVQLSEKDIRRTSDRCTVSAMKQQAGGKTLNIRKGEVGSWKDQLTEAQSESIDRQMTEKLAGTDIAFTYAL